MFLIVKLERDMRCVSAPIYASVLDKRFHRCKAIWKEYTSGPRYWNFPVLVNTGTFLVHQYCLKMWYICSLERAGAIQKLTILERKNGLVLANTRVPESGTWSILFPAISVILQRELGSIKYRKNDRHNCGAVAETRPIAFCTLG